MGAVLAGSREFIERAWRFKQRFGGAMRQAGIIAAAGVYALRHHVERLAEDHERARRLAHGLASIPGVTLNPDRVETNIVVFDVSGTGLTGDEFGKRTLADHGVRFSILGPTTVRAVTHLDVPPDGIERALDAARAGKPILNQALIRDRFSLRYGARPARTAVLRLAMRDEHRPKQDLIHEVTGLRKQVLDLRDAMTARRRVEEALRDAETVLRSLIDGAPVGLCLFRRDGTPLTSNRPFARMLGYDSPAELVRIGVVLGIFATPEEWGRLLASSRSEEPITRRTLPTEAWRQALPPRQGKLPRSGHDHPRRLRPPCRSSIPEPLTVSSQTNRSNPGHRPPFRPVPRVPDPRTNPARSYLGLAVGTAPPSALAPIPRRSHVQKDQSQRTRAGGGPGRLRSASPHRVQRSTAPSGGGVSGTPTGRTGGHGSARPEGGARPGRPEFSRLRQG